MNTAIFTAVCLAFAAMIVFVAMATPNEEMELVVGSPGGGKSYGCAIDAINYPGSCVILDPQKDSIASLVLTHDPSPNLLYDRLSDSDFPLGIAGLLRPSNHPKPSRRVQLDQLRVQTMVEIMMRRAGGDLASTPLKEEWLTAILELFLAQATRKPLWMLPYGFLPGTDEFRVMVRDCTRPELRHKFQQLERLTSKGLRSEVGSAARVVNAIFRSPAVLERLDGEFEIGTFLQKPRARIVIERGDEIDEDAMRTIFGAWSVLIAEYCETRPKPFPPVKVFYEECVSAGTAGKYEERKAAQLRKFGEVMVFISQVLPNSFDGLLTICGRKVVYRIADRDLAHKMAAIAEAGLPPTADETRTERIERLTRMFMNFQPGERAVTDRAGTRITKANKLNNPWPDWPGLREAKLQEKICRIQKSPEYHRTTCDTPPTGGGETPGSSPSSTPSPPLPPSSPPSSPAERFGRGAKRPPSGSADSGSGDGSK